MASSARRPAPNFNPRISKLPVCCTAHAMGSYETPWEKNSIELRCTAK
jgi:hypothetical protein